MYQPAPDADGSLMVEERVSSGGSGRAIWLGALTVALLLVGGGGFLAWRALQTTGGAASPGEAVDGLLLAINEEDFLTVSELLEPGERRTLVEPTLTEILPELERLGILDQPDPGDVRGLDVEITDVTYEIETIEGHDDIAHVFFTGGQTSTTTISDELPWGEAIRSLAGDELSDSSSSEAISRSDDAPLVLVERNGRWYVSLWHTLGEAIRLELGDDLPDRAAGPSPQPSDSPEAAVEAMMGELSEFDLAGIITTIDPEEGAALYRYAPLFLDEAQEALDEVITGEEFSWGLSDFDFDTTIDGDDATVTLRGVTVTFSTPDLDVEATWGREGYSADVSGLIAGEQIDLDIDVTLSGLTAVGTFPSGSVDLRADYDLQTGSFELDGTIVEDGETMVVSGQVQLSEDGCSEFTFNLGGEEETGCLEDELGLGQDALVDLWSSTEDELPEGLPGLAIRAHRTDGGWYVSPTLTVMNGIAASLREIDEDDIELFLDPLNTGGLGGLTFDPAFDPAFDPLRTPPAFDEALDGEETMGDEVGGMTEEPPTEESFDEDLAYVTFDAAPGPEPTVLVRTIDDREIHEYWLFLEAGQTLGVTLYGESRLDGGIIDPFLNLYNESVELVASSDDEDGRDSILGFTAEVDGYYILQLYEYDSRAGTYELTMELDGPGEVPSILSE